MINRFFQFLFFSSLFCIFLFSCKSTQVASKQQVNKKELSIIDRQKFEEHFFNATKSKMLGNFEEAVNNFQKCIAIDPNSAVCYYEIGMLYSSGHLGSEKSKESLQLAKKAVSLDNKNFWYKLLLANLYTRTNEFTKSAALYEELTKQNSERLDLYYDWANVYIYAKKYEDAIKIYDKLESITGISEEISLQKEKIWVNLRKYDKAVAEMEKLCTAFPNDMNYQGMLAELYLMSGNQKKAIDIYKNALDKEPENPFINLSMADYYHLQRDYNKAFGYVRNAFKSPELDIDSKMQMLLQYYSISENDTTFKRMAYSLADILISVHPQEAKSYSIYGDLYFRDKKNKEALEMFYKVNLLDSSRYAVWEHIMMIESELGNYKALEKASSSAVELFPTHPLPYLFNGISNNRIGNYKKSEESLNTGKSYVVDNPDMLAEFYSALGECYHAMQKHDESDEAFENSLKYDSLNAFVMNNFSYYLSQRKTKLNRAEFLAKKANDLFPNQPSFLDTYGWILFVQEKYDEALIYIEKAVQLGGASNATILEHLGDVLFKLNRTEEALEKWKKAAEKGNPSETLKNKIETKKLPN